MWPLTPLIRIYYPFFITLIFLGIFLAISSHSWFSTWIGLEINLYSFIPLLLHSNIQKRKEAAAKYFIAQATGSALLLTATLTTRVYPTLRSTIFLARLLLKGGLAPIHYWYPRIMAISSWFSCYLLSSLQKIAPLALIISSFPINRQTMLLLGTFITLLGGIGGINQTQLRAIIAYSSIGQTGWIIVAAQSSTLLRTLIIINYIITIRATILILSYIEWRAGNESSLQNNRKLNTFLLIILIINLSGLPPLPGFFFKAITIIKLLTIKAIKSTLTVIIGSIIRLYFYLKIIFNTLFRASNKIYLNENHRWSIQNIIISLLSFLRIFIIMLIAPWIL